MANLIEAISHLEKGDWEAAHVIVQEDPSALASWAHAIVHLMEGDPSNAKYWFRRADRDPASSNEIADEIEALKRAATKG